MESIATGYSSWCPVHGDTGKVLVCPDCGEELMTQKEALTEGRFRALEGTIESLEYFVGLRQPVSHYPAEEAVWEREILR